MNVLIVRNAKHVNRLTVRILVQSESTARFVPNSDVIVIAENEMISRTKILVHYV
jgi:hypothetical protein